MNRRMLTEAASIAIGLDKPIINDNFTFETDRTSGEYSGVVDSLYLVDRSNPQQRIKIWEQSYDG